jgi:hypothetical protein
MPDEPQAPEEALPHDPEATEERPRSASYTRDGLEEAGASLLQALGDGLGTFFDRSRTEIETVARTGKSRYDLLQAQRDRDALYRRLGRELHEAARAGDLDLPDHQALLDKIDAALAKIEELDV